MGVTGPEVTAFTMLDPCQEESMQDTGRHKFTAVAAALVGLTMVSCSKQPLMPATGAGLEASTSAAESMHSRGGRGAVFSMSNAASGNEIIVFERGADGGLTQSGTQATGGTGTGADLGNQGGLVLTRSLDRLYAVNAGSNDISTFRVTGGGTLQLGARVPSGGVMPISLTVHGNLLYVLNAGGTGNISAFRIGADGAPAPIPGSARPLSSAAAGPAQIQFSPDGRILVVTEKVTNTISTYVVASDGTASGPNAQPSAGQTPFGFDFNQQGILVVSEAAGGPGGSTASSYRVDGSGHLTLVSGQVATTQTAACWTAIDHDGDIALTSNAGSGTLSSLTIGRNGQLKLGVAAAGSAGAGSHPQDVDFSPGGELVYVRNGAGTISAFRFVEHGEGNDDAQSGLPASAASTAGAEGRRAKGTEGGHLEHLGDFGPLPTGASGLAVR
jgi:6-phosphogluconolactonase (cycloisomerase 2 family)